MGSHTRRQVLSAATLLTFGITGCVGESTEVSQSATESNRYRPPDGEYVADPPMVTARSTATQPPIGYQDAASADTTADNREHQRSRIVIDSPSSAERLVARDGVSAETLHEFVDATDFASETLYLDVQPIKQCFTLSLCYISWQETEIRTAYARRLRSYDAACAADTQARTARLLRLPVALRAESITSRGGRTRSGRCLRAGDADTNTSAATDTATTPQSSSGGGSA